MAHPSRKARALVLAALGTLVGVFAACQPATQVYLVLRSDMPCGALRAEGYAIDDIHIYAGSDRDSVTERVGIKADAILERCSKDPSSNELGRLVLYRDESDEAFVQIVAGLTHTNADGTTERRGADACGFADPNNRNCLMAMRKFPYTRHATGYVPITLAASCIPWWFRCPKGETCIDGACRSDEVTPTSVLEPYVAPKPLDAGASPDASDASTLDASTDATLDAMDASDAGDAKDADASVLPVPAELALGGDHTCARFDNGRVVCWGGNANGQLGYGDTLTRGHTMASMALSFIDLGLTGATPRKVGSIDASPLRTCVVLTNGDIKCWGVNNGHLGIETTIPPNVGTHPSHMGGNLVSVLGFQGLPPITVASLGHYHACATAIGESFVKCWGGSGSGELGNNDMDPHGATPGSMTFPPIDFSPMKVKALSAGASHTCVLLTDANGASPVVRCWGINTAINQARGPGTLGDGTLQNKGDDPNEMGALSNVNLGGIGEVQSIAAGGYHTCALFKNIVGSSNVRCWGNNFYGQLGTGDDSFRGGPAGVQMTGAFGDISIADMPSPFVNLGTGRSAKSIAAGAWHTCAVLDDDTVKCWGRNDRGQLGYGDTMDRGKGAAEMGNALPAVDLGLANNEKVLSVALGAAGADNALGQATHTCALLTSGRVKCWGPNGSGQLGLGDVMDRGSAPNQMGTNLQAVKIPAAPAP